MRILYGSLLLLLLACNSVDKQQFTKLTKGETGVDFRNRLEDSEDMNVLRYIYFYNGAGVATGDVNNDGRPDLFFCGNMVKNRLFLNEGDFQFKDITKTARVAEKEGWCVGATMADVNADGWLDIYICRSADVRPDARRNLLFINDGAGSDGLWRGTFTERGADYGIDDPGYSTQAAFFDMDRDGDLDMVLINHSLSQYTGVEDRMARLKSEKNSAFSSKLYQNEGGHFQDITEAAGITNNVLSFGLGLGISDVNDDHWPDVYVCNDFNEQDYLFINKGAGPDGKTWAGGFEERLPDYMDHTSLFSMGCDWTDINNDGLPDLLTVDMLPEDNFTQKIHMGAENYNKFQLLFNNGFYFQYSRNMLHLNNGDGTFSEIGQLAGVSNTDWSWAGLGADFDNDGWKDLLVTNGYVKDYTDMDFLKYTTDQVQQQRGAGKNMALDLLKTMRGSTLKKYLFHNQGDLTFKNRATEWGLGDEGFSYGAAYVDLDADGDLDIVTNNIDDYAGIYRNNAEKAPEPNHWLRIDLSAPALTGNRRAIGTKVRVYANGQCHFQELMPTRGYASSVDYTLCTGLGKAAQADSIVVIWPDGTIQRLGATPGNQSINIEQVTAVPAAAAIPPPPLFKTETMGFKHNESTTFIDFQVQVLLPGALSRQGPCLAKGDVNGDGLDDVFVGGAKDQASALFLGVRSGGFRAANIPAFGADAASEDTGAAFLDADGDGDQDLYVVSGGYEYAPNAPALHDRLYLNSGKGQFAKAPDSALPAETSAGSCVRPADVDADGDMDLFVGGRVVPGRFPEPDASFLFINDGKGQFSDQTAALAPALAQTGMVTDAQWLDLNGDKKPELVVAGQWMPIRFYDNTGGRLTENTQHLTAPSEGWWNTLVPGDPDADGDIDLLAGNLGLNTQIRASANEPASMLYADFDSNGSIDPIINWYIGGKSYPAAFRDDLADQLPMMKKRFNNFKSYAEVTTDALFTPEQRTKAKQLQATTLQTTLLRNDGNGQFSMIALPTAAQFAPVHTAQWFDADRDGHTDLLLAGNDRHVRIRFGRYDALHGLLLRGDGKGNFTPVPAARSGLRLRSDVRSSVLIDQNGKKSVIFGVNDGEMVKILE
jgi:enediyne biosynthesis protein E4